MMDTLFRKVLPSWELHGTFFACVKNLKYRKVVFRSILHDPEVFEAPEEFRPERYLKDGQINPNVRDPVVAAFGFGRR